MTTDFEQTKRPYTPSAVLLTASDVFELRKQGRIEEAYEAIRQLYASDKGHYTSLAMFWTANDILKKRLNEGRIDEAEKISAALERMLPNVPDQEGWVGKAFKRSKDLLEKAQQHVRQQEEGPAHLLTGVWGEGLAAAYLRDKGYVILERDWHSGHRDIDIIAQQGGITVFVEVKTRGSSDFADPIDAVDLKKQKNLLLAINHYIRYKRITSAWRFDVISIVGKPGNNNPEIDHIEDFQLSQPCYSGDRRWR